MPTKPGGKNGTKYLTPKTMWDFFEGYRIHTKQNPIIVTDWVGKDALEVDRKKERPLTLEGFENYLANKGVIKDIGDYFTNNGGDYTEFIQICKRIKNVIRQDQIEGGMAMIYNPSITQRLNSLVEKTENRHEVSEIIIKHES